MDKILRINMGADGGPAIHGRAAGRLCRSGRPCHDLCDCFQGSPAALPSAGRRQQTGHRAGAAQRHRRRHVRPAFGGLQKPADRRHQGSQCRRPGGPGAGPAGICRHRSGRQTHRMTPSTRFSSTRTASPSSRTTASSMLGNYDLVDKMKAEYGEKICLHLHRPGR